MDTEQIRQNIFDIEYKRAVDRLSRDPLPLDVIYDRIKEIRGWERDGWPDFEAAEIPAQLGALKAYQEITSPRQPRGDGGPVIGPGLHRFLTGLAEPMSIPRGALAVVMIGSFLAGALMCRAIRGRDEGDAPRLRRASRRGAANPILGGRR